MAEYDDIKSLAEKCEDSGPSQEKEIEDDLMFAVHREEVERAAAEYQRQLLQWCQASNNNHNNTTDLSQAFTSTPPPFQDVTNHQAGLLPPASAAGVVPPVGSTDREIEEVVYHLSLSQAKEASSAGRGSSKVDSNPKKCVLNVKLIADRCLSQKIEVGQQEGKDVTETEAENEDEKEDEAVESLLRITHLDLQQCGLTDLADTLDCFTYVTHAFLQYNFLTKIVDSFQYLTSLKVLMLSHNRIAKVGGNLRELPTLQALDLSFNQIDDCDSSCLPKSLRYLRLEGNPVAHKYATASSSSTPTSLTSPSRPSSLLKRLVSDLPQLTKLDDLPVTNFLRIACGCVMTQALLQENADDVDDELQQELEAVKSRPPTSAGGNNTAAATSSSSSGAEPTNTGVSLHEDLSQPTAADVADIGGDKENPFFADDMMQDHTKEDEDDYLELEQEIMHDSVQPCHTLSRSRRRSALLSGRLPATAATTTATAALTSLAEKDPQALSLPTFTEAESEAFVEDLIAASATDKSLKQTLQSFQSHRHAKQQFCEAWLQQPLAEAVSGYAAASTLSPSKVPQLPTLPDKNSGDTLKDLKSGLTLALSDQAVLTNSTSTSTSTTEATTSREELLQDHLLKLSVHRREVGCLKVSEVFDVGVRQLQQAKSAALARCRERVAEWDEVSSQRRQLFQKGNFRDALKKY